MQTTTTNFHNVTFSSIHTIPLKLNQQQQ